MVLVRRGLLTGLLTMGLLAGALMPAYATVDGPGPSTKVTEAAPGPLAARAATTGADTRGRNPIAQAGAPTAGDRADTVGNAVASAPTGSLFTSITPVRVLDTRDGTGTGGVVAPVGAGVSIVLNLSTQVPATATAVLLNVTTVNATAPTYVTAYPDGASVPTASNINVSANEIQPNAVTVALGADHEIDLYNFAGSADLVADLSGYYATGSGAGFTPIAPVRVLDTRSGTGTGGVVAPVGAGKSIVLNLSTQVPATATAVTFNLTGVNATQGTFVTAYPDGTTLPLASNLNLAAGDVTPNQVTVLLGTNHKVDLYNLAGSVDLVADLSGYYAPGSGNPFFPVTPERVLDTRQTGPLGATGPLGPGGSSTLSFAPWVPGSTTAVVFNLTGTDVTAGTYAQVTPQGSPVGVSSSLNLAPGQTAANLVTVQVGQGTADRLYNHSGTIDLIADLAGYFAPIPTACTSDCVEAWGDNTYGQLGNGTVGGGDSQPEPIAGLSNVASVAAGSVTGYARGNDGTVRSWGANGMGQMGNGFGYGTSPTPNQVGYASGVGAASTVVGSGNTAFSLTGNQVYAWGDNADGEGGLGTTATQNSPAATLVSNATQVAAGYATGYALTTAGKVESWGINGGALGNGSYGTGCGDTPVDSGCLQSTPTVIAGLSNVVSIAADWDNAFAIESNGSVWAWGWNAEGELGNGTVGGAGCYTDATQPNCVATAPVEISGLTGITKIVGGVATAYAITSTGTVESWGSNQEGELGVGTDGAGECQSDTPPTTCWSATPVAVSGLTAIKDIAAGSLFAEALTTSGTVLTWGDDTFGQLGLTGSSDSPETVTGLPVASAIGAGGYNGYAVVATP